MAASSESGSRVMASDVTQTLRSHIVEGRYPPGARLPNRTEIQSTFNASPTTVQKALDDLRRDGFVRPRGRAGTFVTDHPPHLCRIGLVLARQSPTAPRSRFLAAIEKEAKRLPRTSTRKLQVYHNVDAATDSPAFERLLDELSRNLMGGLILVSVHPSTIEALGVTDNQRLSRVGVMLSPFPGVPQVLLDPVREAELVVRNAKASGCRSLGVIASATCEVNPKVPSRMDIWRRTAEAHGLRTESYWTHAVHPDIAHASRPLAQLMFRNVKTDRPDALAITDDNLVEHVTQGLRDAQVQAEKDVIVYAHCNFPWPPPSVVPVRHVGYDVRQILDTCLTIVQQQIEGIHMAGQVAIAPVFQTTH